MKLVNRVMMLLVQERGEWALRARLWSAIEVALSQTSVGGRSCVLGSEKRVGLGSERRGRPDINHQGVDGGAGPADLNGVL
jgi:hypothetical protein